jgi:hydrogenase maturation protein HypF
MFLVHDRPIRRHADDSIVRIMLGREQVLRRARGYAPMPIRTAPGAAPTLAVGGHLKNTVAMKVDGDVFVSQHVGDLETKEAFDAFTRVIDDFQSIYAVQPRSIATDLHPDYASTQYANRLSQSRSIPIERVQHHWAHVLSCMADNGVDPPALGVAWDGSGYGPDGTVWGGEFLLAHAEGFRRVAHLRTFPLPGGDAAVKRPNQTAAGVLYEIFGEESFAVEQDGLVRQMLQKEVRCPRTSSAGRLFDAVAYLIGIRDRVSFEGQAAMRLEYLAATDVDESYEFTIQSGSPLVIDWAPMIRQILDEAGAGISPPAIAAKFHNTLAKMIVEVAQLIGEKRVLLTGGCFQNRYLTERAVQRLTDAGFTPHWHQRIPPNDGGIALGQAIGAEASHRSFKQEQACVLQFQAR